METFTSIFLGLTQALKPETDTWAEITYKDQNLEKLQAYRRFVPGSIQAQSRLD